MMMEHEENLAQAANYLVSIGHLQKCDYHDENYGGAEWDLEAEFWKNVMADRNRGENGPVPWAIELEAREFTDTIKEAYEEYCGDECGRCAKLMAE